MKTKSFLFLLSTAFLFTISICTVQAQDRTGETVRVTTTDGNIFIGVVESESDHQITLRVEGIGEINLEKSIIRRVQILDSDRVRNGEYWFENPHSTRYFFAPNAIGLKKGAGYYQNAWIFFNNVNYGVSDNFSIGAGTVPIFLFGVSAFPLWVLPKLSIPVTSDNINVAAGALIGGVIGEDSVGFGLAYGNATFGDRDKNITVGLGYGYGGGEWSSTPLVNVSGLYRSGMNFQWLGEIYFLPGIEGSGFGIFGARWAPERFAVDFGIGRPLTSTEFIGLPWLGVSIPFGNR